MPEQNNRMSAGNRFANGIVGGIKKVGSGIKKAFTPNPSKVAAREGMSEEEWNANQEALAQQEGNQLAQETQAVQPIVEQERVANEQGTSIVPNPTAATGANEVEDVTNQAIDNTPTATNETTPVTNDVTQEDMANADAMVAEAEETAKNPTPQDVQDSVNQMVEYMQKMGLVTIDENGQVQFTEPKTPTSSTLARIGTIVSALACVATGGMIPPMNLYKLTGREDKDKLIYENYRDLMKQVSTELGDVFGDYYRANVDASTEQSAGSNRFTSQGGVAAAETATEQQLKVVAQQQKNVIEQMAVSNANSKDYAEYMARLSANELPYAIAAARDAGISLNDIAKYAKSKGGITGWDDALNKASKISNIAGNVVNAVK